MVNLESWDESKPCGLEKVETRGREEQGYGRRANFIGDKEETM